jgi:hypothetical protein
MGIVVFCERRGWNVLINCDNRMRRVEARQKVTGNKLICSYFSYLRTKDDINSYTISFN